MKASISTGALALTLLLGACGEGATGGNASANAPMPAAIPAPNGGDWSQTVAATPEGGFVMGNPNAPVKLVEYASLTCSHCADFAVSGTQPLVDNYVKTGRVSYEIRSFVRDPADIGAALLARCNGPAAFFKISDQMYASQAEWLGKLQTMSPADQQRLQSMQPLQAVQALAQAAGLVDFVRVRGVPAQKAQQCLSNQAEMNRLVQMQQKVTQDMPDFPGTPTFTINGKMAPNAGTWTALEPQLRAAVGA